VGMVVELVTCSEVHGCAQPERGDHIPDVGLTQ
jgi:hypothetical protein